MKRNTISRIIKSTAFALSLVVFGGIISAQPQVADISATTTQELQDKIDKLNEKNKELEEKIASLDVSISESTELQGYYFDLLVNQEEEIDLLNNKIYYKERDIEEKKQDIADIEQSILDNERIIADKERRIITLEAKNSENIYKFGQIIRAMYLTDNYDAISVLMGSTDFYDLLVRAELLQNIGEQNMKFMNDLMSDIETLENDQKTLQQDIDELDAKKIKLASEQADLEMQKSELQQQYADSKALSDEYNANYYNYSALIVGFEQKQEQYEQTMKANAADIKAYEEQIDEIIRLAQQQASNNVTYQNGEWLWPLDYKYRYISTYFGYDDWRKGNHSGIDIGDSGINNSNIYASKSGEVIVAQQTYIQGYSYGKYIVIDHGSGYHTLYGHCSEVSVNVGDFVTQGQVIGKVGSTGWSTGPHLHFEVRHDGVRKDPFDYVDLPT